MKVTTFLRLQSQNLRNVSTNRKGKQDMIVTQGQGKSQGQGKTNPNRHTLGKKH
jgi:hypothetical protein